MRPKHRPPRPKHPKFTHFHRSGLRFGRFPAQRRSIGGVGRHRRAWLRCPWAAAGPGRASRRRVELPNSDPAPQVWRAPEGSAAVPVGGGGAWPGFETTRQATRQRTRRRRCGGRRRDQMARPRCRWAAAGPGRASRSTTPSRRLACGDLAGGPPPTGTHSGRAPQSSPARQVRPDGAWNTSGATSNPAQQAAKNGYDSETSPRGSRRDRPR